MVRANADPRRSPARNGRRITALGQLETLMATLESVESSVIRLLGEKVEGDLTLTADTNILADTGLDSVSVMDFVFELEDEFGITVPMDRIADVKTVRELSVAIHGLILEEA